LWASEDSVLCSLQDILGSRSMSGFDVSMDDRGMDWVLAASHDIHTRLTALTQARSTARTIVRIAPRRMSMRAAVTVDQLRVARMYLLAGAVIGLMRATMDTRELDGAPSRECLSEIDQFILAVGTLAGAPRPWPPTTVDEVGRNMNRLLQSPLPSESPGSAVVATAARRVADDLLHLLPPALARG
jgi:hypothetical protein